MPGGPEKAEPVATSVRFTNDSKEPADLLWHREMEGGLIVGQHLSEILPGRSRIIRSFSGHSFSMWQNDNEVQHWTMVTAKRQHYKISSASRVPPIPDPAKRQQLTPSSASPTAVPSATSPPPTKATADATKQPDPQVLAEARKLVVNGKYREALVLFRSAGEIDATQRPKLAARLANLERIVASEDMVKGRVASTMNSKPSETTSGAVSRCDKCTLPKPCGKVHAAKRTYAEVVASKQRDSLIYKQPRSVPAPPLPERPRPWRSAMIGAKMRPVSAAATAERVASEERLKNLIARANESRERARAAAQRAQEIREAAHANTRRMLAGRGFSSSSDEDDDLGPQQELKRRRPAVQITTPSDEVLKHSYRQATPRPSSVPGGNTFEKLVYRRNFDQGIPSY